MPPTNEPAAPNVTAAVSWRATQGRFGREAQASSSIPTGVPERRDRLPAGRVVQGIYRVREPVGSGGLGQVIDAMDESLGRRVALKVSWENDDRLRVEARTIAPFRHASLPTIHAFGSDDGVDFVVLERLYGVTLADQLELIRDSESVLPVEEVESIVHATADALSVIHEAGLCHLDIRPSNIISTPDRRTVLLDFGLVVPELGVARQARVASNLMYAAPEIRGPLDAAGGRLADLYSLGVTAFQLLTGKLPHSVASIAALTDVPIPVPSVTQSRPDVSRDLADLVDAMLDPNPARRPDSADVVRRRLSRSVRPQRSDRRIRLMIVDDSPFVAKTLSRYAQETLDSVELQVHHDAESAIDAMHTWEPDIMLLDLRLPGMSGIELCMYMRGSNVAPKCEIISVSARAKNEDRDLLHTLGIRHFLSKDEELSGHLAVLLKRMKDQLGA